MTGEQLGKDMKWHNITTCSSANFASEASTMIWAYFSRHGDSCASFSECINVDCSSVDTDFIAFGITIIAYINSVGLLLFSTIVSMAGWFLVWILLTTDGALASGITLTNLQQDWHVESMAGQEALSGVHGVLCNSHMHVGSVVLMFSVVAVGGMTEVVCSIC